MKATVARITACCPLTQFSETVSNGAASLEESGVPMRDTSMIIPEKLSLVSKAFIVSESSMRSTYQCMAAHFIGSSICGELAMQSSKKERADVILVQMGFFETREQAKAALLEGRVLFDGKAMNKAGTKVAKPKTIDVKKPSKYVSRGGTKLEKAIEVFNLEVKDKTAIDVGAGTGGFSDCLLQYGARSVTAVDVGYGQLAWKLRNDPRVRVIERTNIRYFEPEELGEKADIAVVDVSFISVTKIIENLLLLLKPKAEIVILVKPQFEAGREFVGKNGVVTIPRVHWKVLRDVIDYAKTKGLAPIDVTFSPILGPKGNIEFFVYLKSDKDGEYRIAEHSIIDVVKEAHQSLRSLRIELKGD